MYFLYDNNNNIARYEKQQNTTKKRKQNKTRTFYSPRYVYVIRSETPRTVNW